MARAPGGATTTPVHRTVRKVPRPARSARPWSSSPLRRRQWPRRACCGGAGWRRRPQRRGLPLPYASQPATRLTMSANTAGDVTGSKWPESRRITSTGGGSLCTMTSCISGLIGGLLVHHVGDGHAGGGGPVDGLEVVVHRVLHRARRIEDEGQGGVVERLAAVGAAGCLGIGRRRQGDRQSVPRRGLHRQAQAVTVPLLHAVDAAPALHRHRARRSGRSPVPGRPGRRSLRARPGLPRSAPPA